MRCNMKKSIILVIIIILLFVAVFFGYRYLSEQYAPAPLVPESSGSEPQSNEAQSGGSESSAPEVSQTADFTVTNAAGETVKLSDNFGKPIVVNFWASWCGYCKMEFPDFEEAYKTYGDDVVFMMVNTGDDSIDSAVSFADKNSYTFPVYFDGEASASNAYSISGIPVTLFINADGSLYSKNIGMLSAEKITEGLEAITASALS